MAAPAIWSSVRAGFGPRVGATGRSHRKSVAVICGVMLVPAMRVVSDQNCLYSTQLELFPTYTVSVGHKRGVAG